MFPPYICQNVDPRPVLGVVWGWIAYKNKKIKNKNK